MPRFLPIFVLTGSLMACTTVAEQKLVAINDGVHNASVHVKACAYEVKNRPEFNAIQPHLGETITAADLADTAFPTAAEAEQLKRFVTSDAACAATFRAEIAAVDPVRAEVFDQYYFGWNSIQADLIMRKINWAEAARREQELKSNARSAFRAANDATVKWLQAQHQQELAERAEFANELAIGLASGAAIYEQTHPRPVYVVAPHRSCQGRVNPGGAVWVDCD